MKTANSFYWTFIDTLVYNIATICAIVVGLYQFAVRAYNDNNGNAKVRQFVIQTLQVINTLTSKIYENLNHDVPVVKVAQKTAKRR